MQFLGNDFSNTQNVEKIVNNGFIKTFLDPLL